MVVHSGDKEAPRYGKCAVDIPGRFALPRKKEVVGKRSNAVVLETTNLGNRSTISSTT